MEEGCNAPPSTSLPGSTTAAAGQGCRSDPNTSGVNAMLDAKVAAADEAALNGIVAASQGVRYSRDNHTGVPVMFKSVETDTAAGAVAVALDIVSVLRTAGVADGGNNASDMAVNLRCTSANDGRRKGVRTTTAVIN